MLVSVEDLLVIERALRVENCRLLVELLISLEVVLVCKLWEERRRQHQQLERFLLRNHSFRESQTGGVRLLVSRLTDLIVVVVVERMASEV